jgi:ferredoxin-NADP reductase
MKIVNKTLAQFFNSAILIDKNKIADRTYHLKLQLKSGGFKNYVPGQHLSMLVGLDDTSLFENPTRCYSVWNYDKDKQQVDVAACTFSRGIGTRWLHQLNIADRVHFSGPEGKFTFAPHFTNYVFLGDVSALGHLYHIRRQLSSSQKSFGLLCSTGSSYIFSDIDDSSPFEHIHAEKAPVDETEIFLASLQHLKRQDTVVYLAGETAFC